MVKKKRSSDRVTDLDIVTAIHNRRGKHAREVDEGTAARITKNVGLWSFSPNRFDFLGVDTPNVKRKPKNLNPKRALAVAKKKGFMIG